MSKVAPRIFGLCLGLAAVVALAAGPAAAQKAPTKVPMQVVRSGPITLTAVPEARPEGAAPSSKATVRVQLKPEYLKLQTSATFQAFQKQLAENMNRPEVVDKYLAFMPISPLEYLQIDMQTRHYEVAVPRFMFEWHKRWIELHEAQARATYGDTYVDSIMAGWPIDTSGDADANGLATRTTIGTNRNVASTFSPAPETFQGEIQVSVNPNNPNQIVAAANTWDTMGGACAGGIQAIFYSSDGGATWGYTCAPGQSAYSGLSCSGTVYGSDPALSWDDSNNVYINHMLICAIGNNNYVAMVVAKSTNGGATWSGQGVVKNSWGASTFEDKNFFAIDNNSSSPYYGRQYTCWDRDNNEKMAYSTNGGSSWTEVDVPTATSGTYDLGCDLAIEKNGTVHIVFDTLTCGTNCTAERMYATHSTNGGASWSTPVLVNNSNLVAFSTDSTPGVQDNRGIGPFGAVDVDNSGGACDGTVYATFGDTSSTAATADIYVSRSTNGGASWSAPVKVNDDSTSRTQFHPFLVVDQSNGQVVVAWHDARNDSNNRKVDFYTARSTDCGQTFQANVKVSSASSEFNNSSISYSDENTSDNGNANPNQYGEYLGLDAQNCKAYLAWTDTRHFYPGSSTESQAENVGFSTVDFECGTGGPVCGNNTTETGETCDGTDLNGLSCTNFGFTGGTLGCASDCQSYDTSGCTNNTGPVCGNGVIETGEDCDGTNLGGASCTSLGFSGGTLSCSSTCTYDTSACTTGTCTTTTLYSNNFDSTSGLSDWYRGTFDGSSTNVWRGVQSCTAASSPNIFRFGGTSCTRNYSSNRFIFAEPGNGNGIAVPTGATDTRLTFDHRRQFETNYDGGLVALSLNGSNYTVVPAADIISGASYNGTVAAACEPTGSAGLPIFTGTQSSFVSTEIDLDAACNLVTGGTGGCSGRTLYIAFTGITDCSVTYDGWFLDNVTVTACN